MTQLINASVRLLPLAIPLCLVLLSAAPRADTRSVAQQVCVAKWVEAYREDERQSKGRDDPDMIRFDIIEEWDKLCKEGKSPGRSLPISPIPVSQDVLACSPQEARSKAIAICATAVGGCAVAASMASSSFRSFLQGEACGTLVGQITGQNYDLGDVLGSALLSGLNAVADETIRRNEDVATAVLVKLFVVGARVYQFSTCVDSAQAMCTARFNNADMRTAYNEFADPVDALVSAYYSALSSGDARRAASLRGDQMTDKFMTLFARSTHVYEVKDKTFLSCGRSECDLAVDVLAKSRSDGNQERWLVKIKTAKTNDGQWLIYRISGSNIYADLGKLVNGYFGALSTGDLLSAKSLWLEPPTSLDRPELSSFSYAPQAWVTRASQLNAELKLELTAKPKGSDVSSRSIKWSGVATAVNADGHWKFTSMELRSID